METLNSIASKHEEILETLLQQRSIDGTLTFKFRSTNRYNRLKKGFWFYGNEDYIAISFWGGMDWRNKTPNIYIYLDENQIKLQISVSDNEEKEKFIDENLVEVFGLEKNNYRYSALLFKGKTFDEENYLNEIKKFISKDGLKNRIDSIIEKRAKSNLKNELVKISEGEFNKSLNRINDQYRSVIKSFLREKKIDQILNLPQVVNGIELKLFLGVDDCVIDTINCDSQFVFLTGLNGVGKTSILKGIFCALTGNHQILIEKEDPGHYEVTLDYSINSITDKVEFFASKAYRPESVEEINVFGYGPFRLKTNRRKNPSQEEGELADLDSLAQNDTNNLFDPEDSVLLDIEEGYKKWRLAGIDEETISQREVTILETLQDIVPGFTNAFFGHYNSMNGIWEESLYQFKETEEHPIITVRFDQIASGAKSVINFVGDLIIRLYDLNKDSEDVSNMPGVVIIDEIDVHLHPKLQKKLVEVLKATFPNIQFIVSTHSPIPLLAASDTDKVFVVQKDPSLGIICKEFDDMSINRLTPNTLLTSPIFGMESIFSDYKNEPTSIRTEKSWKEIKFNQRVKEELNKIYNESE
jgi:predicted ATP-binding protein involved in virulence